MFAFVFFAASAVALTSLATPVGDLDAAFEILRKGEPIGYHIVRVEETEEGVFVDTRIKMKVKFGPIPLYKYRHVAREVWRDGALQRLNSETDDNGDRMSLNAHRESGVLLVEGDAYNGPVPESAMPSSYWNKDLLSSHTLINTQNGELISVETSKIGKTPAPGGDQAEQYRIVGTLELDIWYDGDRWVGCNFIIEGEEFTYKRIDTLEEEQALLALYD